jgi:hypothetical protein
MRTEEEIKEYLADTLNAIVFSGREYEEYKLLMIEEANDILSNRERYVISSPLPIHSKLSRINDLIDFFTLQEEKEIVRDLENVRDSIRLRFYFKEFV